MSWILDLLKIGRTKEFNDWARILNEQESVIRGVIIQTTSENNHDILIFEGLEYGKCTMGTDVLTITNLSQFKRAINIAGRQYRQ